MFAGQSPQGNAGRYPAADRSCHLPTSPTSDTLSRRSTCDKIVERHAPSLLAQSGYPRMALPSRIVSIRQPCRPKGRNSKSLFRHFDGKGGAIRFAIAPHGLTHLGQSRSHYRPHCSPDVPIFISTVAGANFCGHASPFGTAVSVFLAMAILSAKKAVFQHIAEGRSICLDNIDTRREYPFGPVF
jgi:hypothetical protein